ncbi:MAG: T9SS type A sorting domain-containing protein [Bacteroidales bacterium]|nr:T9SS type A sorting domain-containing protein [Bacteroidales bacterium]
MQGCISTVSKNVLVSTNTDIEARFNVNEETQCLAGNVFVFTNNSKLTTPNHYLSDYKWYFGDGDSAMTRNATWTYTEAGSYEVTLVITEMPGGTQSTLTKTIKVIDRPVITDTATIDAVCAGEYLKVQMPEIDWKGTTPITGTWLLDGYVFDVFSRPVSATDNGKLLQYRITSVCGTSISTGKIITVNSKPVMSSIVDDTYCTDGPVPTRIFGNEPGVVYHWKQYGGDMIGLPVTSGTDSMPSFNTINNMGHAITALIEVTPWRGDCAGNTVTFSITVEQPMKLTSTTDLGSVCSGAIVTYEATSNSNPITFSWIRPSITGINLGISGQGSGAKIQEVLDNTTGMPITVTYLIVMVRGQCVDTIPVTVNVLPIPELNIPAVTELCEGVSVAKLPYQLTIPSLNDRIGIHYSISFGENALIAGFDDVTFALLQNDTIVIPIPPDTKPGSYVGSITTYSDEGCLSLNPVQFTLRVLPSTVITEQPTPVYLCGEDGFSLSVSAQGRNLTCQWYKDNLPLIGETSFTYTVLASSSADYGTYFAEITGDCGIVNSNTVEVGAGRLVLKTKWEDLIYIANVGDYFVAYQWYKNDMPIGKNGNYQSYAEPDGEKLDGTYKVRVTYADGTQEMSCPYTVVATKSKSDIEIFPNPVTENVFRLDIEALQRPDRNISDVTVDIMEITGRIIKQVRLNSWIEDIDLITSDGTYLIRVTTGDGKIVVKRIVVKN